MVFKATFNNISAEVNFLNGGNPEKTTDLPVTDKLYHNVISSTPSHEWDSNSHY